MAGGIEELARLEALMAAIDEARRPVPQLSPEEAEFLRLQDMADAGVTRPLGPGETFDPVKSQEASQRAAQLADRLPFKGSPVGTEGSQTREPVQLLQETGRELREDIPEEKPSARFQQDFDELVFLGDF